MAAKVVSASLKVSAWTDVKPADFKGNGLETALKTAEGAIGKSITLPTKLSAVPQLKLSEINSCITQMEADVITLQKALAELRKIESALQAVSSAASKTSAELQKMAKDNKKSEDEQNKYKSAAMTVDVIGSNAASILKNFS